jgi:hypothetical protein
MEENAIPKFRHIAAGLPVSIKRSSSSETKRLSIGRCQRNERWSPAPFPSVFDHPRR